MLPATSFNTGIQPEYLNQHKNGNELFQVYSIMIRNSHHGAAEMNPTRNHEVAGLISGLAQWAKDPTVP